MKIGILAPYSRPWDTVAAEGSGQNVLIRESAEALSEYVQVIVFRRASRSNDQAEILHGDILEQVVPAGEKDRLGREETYHACEENQFPDMVQDIDVWVAHYWVSIAWVRQILRLSTAPVLYFSHAFCLNPLRTQPVQPEHVQAERFAARYCIWCANSRDERDNVIKFLSPSQVELVPPGQSDIPFERKSKLHNSVLFAGRKNNAKGYDIFLEVARQFPQTRFVSVGRNELEMDMPQNVDDRPPLSVSELSRMVRQSDLVLCPSRYEHFGLMPLFSAWSGTPVIASNVGGHLDTVIPGKTSWLSEPTLYSFAGTLKKVLDNPDQIIRLSTIGHQYVAYHFSWESFSKRVLQIAKE